MSRDTSQELYERKLLYTLKGRSTSANKQKKKNSDNFPSQGSYDPHSPAAIEAAASPHLGTCRDQKAILIKVTLELQLLVLEK